METYHTYKIDFIPLEQNNEDNIRFLSRNACLKLDNNTQGNINLNFDIFDDDNNLKTFNTSSKFRATVSDIPNYFNICFEDIITCNYCGEDLRIYHSFRGKIENNDKRPYIQDYKCNCEKTYCVVSSIFRGFIPGATESDFI